MHNICILLRYKYEKESSRLPGKLKYSLVFIGLYLMLGGCSKSDDLTGIEMPYRYQFDVPAGLNPLNTHYFQRNGVFTNVDALLGTDSESNRIIPYRARLTSLDNVDFSFIREIEVLINDPDKPNIQIPVFYREEIPANTGRNIDLIATQADITGIMNRNEFDITISFMLYGTSGQSFVVDVDLAFLAQ